MLSVALGVLGIVLPLLPTTVFLLLAAWCFARSSERFHAWLMNNRVLGGYLSAYHSGQGMSIRDKWVTLATLWIGIGASAVFFVAALWVRVLLVAIAAGVTLHIVRLPTFRVEQARVEILDEGVPTPPEAKLPTAG